MHKSIVLLVVLFLQLVFSEELSLNVRSVSCDDSACRTGENEAVELSVCDLFKINLVIPTDTICLENSNDCYIQPLYTFELKKIDNTYHFRATNTLSALFYEYDYQCGANEIVEFTERVEFRDLSIDAPIFCEIDYEDIDDIPLNINLGYLERRVNFLCDQLSNKRELCFYEAGEKYRINFNDINNRAFTRETNNKGLY